MNSLLRIAFRNVLRNRRRSIITFSAVFLVLGVMVGLRGFLNGMQETIRESVILGQTGDRFEPRAAVDREALHLVPESRSVADEVLRGQPAGELRQHLGELGMDGGAVVTLHEVLDDQLPVGRHVVHHAATQGEVVDAVVVDGLGVTQTFGDRADHVVEVFGAALKRYPRVSGGDDD